MLHVCAAVDTLLFRAGIYKNASSCIIKIRKVFRKVFIIQDMVNFGLLVVFNFITKEDDERLRYALYKIANVEPGENPKLDDNFESLIRHKKSMSDSAPGEPLWVFKYGVAAMSATIAIWLLALIH